MTTPAEVPQAKGRDVWRIVGIILAVLFVIAGLAVLAFIVLFVVAIASFGSNK